MFSQMDLWFQQNQGDNSNSTRSFRPDIIDLKKLIDSQDINQLLVLVEFILCIVLKCQNSADLCSRFLDLEASAMEDIKRLIDSSQVEVSEY